MRDYGRVPCPLWSDPKFISLSDDGRLLLLYLLTSVHGTIAGVFRMPDGYAAEDLNWLTERVAKGFLELCRNGLAYRCETTKWAWVVDHLTSNPLANPNQRKAAAKCASLVPDQCAWKPAFIRACGPLIDLPTAPDAEPSEKGSETVAETVAESVTVAVPGEVAVAVPGEENARKRSSPPPRPEEVDEQVWLDWLQLRKAKRATVTETVLGEARKEAAKADSRSNASSPSGVPADRRDLRPIGSSRTSA